ncbi:MAG: DUF5302 domain-containing protein [Cellulomonadaceae bacterium]|jgi:hypothetical protein|nr:DUF5302 domain-containing protein [Cellulomonadaceae bacterium]
MSDDKSEAAANADSSPAPTDAKARFKAALDAKNAKSRAASAGGSGDAGTQKRSGETTGPTQRMFRRKAGG